MYELRIYHKDGGCVCVNLKLFTVEECQHYVKSMMKSFGEGFSHLKYK